LQQIDLFPTFCQLAGIDPPDDLQGISIIDALRDPATVPVPRYVISEYNCYGIHRTSIRTRAHKLIRQTPAERDVYMKHVKDPKYFPSVSFDQETFQLYNMLKDPREERNLWPELKDQVGRRLLSVLKDEMDTKRPPRKIKDLDPDLIEELRSMGYVQ
jgi:arylsulfatase A-like enzyme